MKVRIKGVEGYIKKMRANYSYCEGASGMFRLAEIKSYTVTIIQDDLTEVKFSNVQPSEIEIIE